MTIAVAGEELELLPERAVYWAKRGTLFLADTHWGKAATLRANAIPVPAGGTADDLARLTRAVETTNCRRIVLLGDALHARAGRVQRTFEALADWRARHPTLEFLLVRGNHDKRAGDPPRELRIRCTDAPVIEKPFVFQHQARETELGYALAGHLHPAVKIHGRGRQSATLLCFWFTNRVATLPAFSSFCGRFVISPEASDRVFAIAEDEVLPV